MSKTRASNFQENAEELDLGSFAPKSAIDAKAPAAEHVRAVAEAANFRSREGASSKAAPSKRTARVYRTERNVQFNVKAMKETVDAFYAVAEARGWVLGYTFGARNGGFTARTRK